jgi:hypothetical protein
MTVRHFWRMEIWCMESRMPPILDNKNPKAASIFQPAALLREARRQKSLGVVEVPRMCILDPDGDIVRRLRRAGDAPLRGMALL